MRARRRRAARVLVGTVAALAVAAPPAAAVPTVRQLVVQRDGHARQAKVKADRTQAKVGGRTCTVPSGTALAALLLSDVPKVRLHDYGSCSSRAQDAGGLFVRSIDGDDNKGSDGWVYKVDNKVATAGAADPSGPFGNGRLDGGARVTWFYCHLSAANHSCQRTLGIAVTKNADKTLHVHVTAYDDRGHGKPAAGATVHAGAATATTNASGDANIAPAPGRRRVFAAKPGAIRSFAKEVTVG
jgi:hypothetical protein